jgi:hypothetical protein
MAAFAADSYDKSAGGTGGGSDGTTMDRSSGGATGGAAMESSTATRQGGMTGGSAQSLDKFKKDAKDRLTAIENTKKASEKSMTSEDKKAMKPQMDQFEQQRKDVKKKIDDLKTEDQAKMMEIDNSLSGLEQSARSMNTKAMRSTPAGDKSSSGSSTSGSSGGSTGGAAGSSSMEQGAGGGMSGGAVTTSTGTENKSAVKTDKKELNKRLEKVDRDLKDIDKAISAMPTDKRPAMQLKADQLKGERDGVSKMIKDMKTDQERSKIDEALTKLDQSATQLKSSMLRTSPAGDMSSDSSSMSTSTGGVTGGSSMGTSTMTTGGMTGGAQPLEFSYDQRDQFVKTEKTKIDGFDKRIAMLDENAKKAPQNINTALTPKVGDLRSMSTSVSDDLRQVKDSKRADWTKTKANIEDKISKLEQALMETEKMVR